MSTHTRLAGGNNQPPEAKPTIYLNAAQVRTRYGGVSDMALWRWLHDEDLKFPKPLRINGRRFWNERELTAWDCTRRNPDGEAA